MPSDEIPSVMNIKKKREEGVAGRAYPSVAPHLVWPVINFFRSHGLCSFRVTAVTVPLAISSKNAETVHWKTRTRWALSAHTHCPAEKDVPSLLLQDAGTGHHPSSGSSSSFVRNNNKFRIAASCTWLGYGPVRPGPDNGIKFKPLFSTNSIQWRTNLNGWWWG